MTQVFICIYLSLRFQVTKQHEVMPIYIFVLACSDIFICRTHMIFYYDNAYSYSIRSNRQDSSNKSFDVRNLNKPLNKNTDALLFTRIVIPYLFDVVICIVVVAVLSSCMAWQTYFIVSFWGKDVTLLVSPDKFWYE